MSLLVTCPAHARASQVPQRVPQELAAQVLLAAGLLAVAWFVLGRHRLRLRWIHHDLKLQTTDAGLPPIWLDTIRMCVQMLHSDLLPRSPCFLGSFPDVTEKGLHDLCGSPLEHEDFNSCASLPKDQDQQRKSSSVPIDAVAGSPASSSAHHDSGLDAPRGQKDQSPCCGLNATSPAPSAPKPLCGSQCVLRLAMEHHQRGSQGAARAHALQAITVITQGKDRFQFKPQHRRHSVVLKVPGPVHPESLPASAIPSLAFLLNTRSPKFSHVDIAVRSGCILLTIDLNESLQGAQGSGEAGMQRLEDHFSASAQAWMQQTQLAAQLPASARVHLQVNNTRLVMVHDPATSSWTVVDSSPLSSGWSITAAPPVALLPTHQQQHQRCSSEGFTMELCAHVRVPAGSCVVGWDSLHSAPTAQPVVHDSGDDGGTHAMQVLAKLNGSSYMHTQVEAAGHVEAAGASKLRVRVSLPADQAGLTRPCALALELWQQHTLHSSSTLLLLPASLEGAAAELQQLPWAEGDVTDYVCDLSKWLHQHSTPVHLSTPAHACSTPSAHWQVGQQLLRQSVLWGLPAVSTLLLESLMALPSAPAMPLTHMAHEPTLNPAAQVLSLENLDLDDLGGLLHLALLCPASNTMLAAVLDWGRRWGAREPGFAWRWGEHSRAGLSPLDILATMPRDSETVQLVLREAPELSHAVHATTSVHSQHSHGHTLSSEPHSIGEPRARHSQPDSHFHQTPGFAVYLFAGLGLLAQAIAAANALSRKLARALPAAMAALTPRLSARAAGSEWAASQTSNVGTAIWLQLKRFLCKLGGGKQSNREDATLATGSQPGFHAWSNSQVILVTLILTRFCWVAALGMGLVGLSSSALLVLGMRIEYFSETILMSSLERVRFSWMCPLRFLLFISYGMLYHTFGRARPYLESATVNLAGLAVTKILEDRMRRLFIGHRQQRLSSKVEPCAEDLKEDPEAVRRRSQQKVD